MYHSDDDMIEDRDVNGDENVNILDIIILVNYILDPDSIESDFLDINNDENINILDIIYLVNIVLSVGERG